MTTPSEGLPRLLRAAALAVVTVCLAVVAHLTGGGSLPGVGVLLVLVGAVATLAVVASGRRLGAPALAGLLTGGQLLLHGAFTVLGRTGTDPASLGHLEGHGHHLALVTHAGSHAHLATAHVGAAHPAIEHLGHAHHGGLLMLAAHLVATLATAAVLGSGERALWVLAALVAPVIRLVRVTAERPHPTRPATVLPQLVAADVVRLTPRRGPPPVCVP